MKFRFKAQDDSVEKLLEQANNLKARAETLWEEGKIKEAINIMDDEKAIRKRIAELNRDVVKARDDMTNAELIDKIMDYIIHTYGQDIDIDIDEHIGGEIVYYIVTVDMPEARLQTPPYWYYHIHPEEKTFAKYRGGHRIIINKEDLQFFDLLDFEVKDDTSDYGQLEQSTIDWTNDDEDDGKDIAQRFEEFLNNKRGIDYIDHVDVIDDKIKAVTVYNHEDTHYYIDLTDKFVTKKDNLGKGVQFDKDEIQFFINQTLQVRN